MKNRPWRSIDAALLRNRFDYVKAFIKRLIGDIQEGSLDYRAMSLVYTTLLSLAPLLAVSFSVLTAFGVHNQMEPVLLELVAPLGEQGAEIVDRTIGFVGNIRVGVLGFIGFAMLFYTVLSLLQKIEESFNYVWRVRRLRSFQRRFGDYLSLLLVGPVLVFSALGLIASMANTEIAQTIIRRDRHTAGPLSATLRDRRRKKSNVSCRGAPRDRCNAPRIQNRLRPDPESSSRRHPIERLPARGYRPGNRRSVLWEPQRGYGNRSV